MTSLEIFHEKKFNFIIFKRQGYHYTKENANLTSGILKISVTINITIYAFAHIDAKNDVIKYIILGINN